MLVIEPNFPILYYKQLYFKTGCTKLIGFEFEFASRTQKTQPESEKYAFFFALGDRVITYRRGYFVDFTSARIMDDSLGFIGFSARFQMGTAWLFIDHGSPEKATRQGNQAKKGWKLGRSTSPKLNQDHR